MGKCKMCGKCCTVVILRISMEAINEHIKNFPDDYNFKFASKHFHKIPYEYAMKLVPELISAIKNNELREIEAVHFYTCDLFDSDNKTCSIHNSLSIKKPNVCKNFPWYGRSPSINETFLFDDCGYKEDQINAQLEPSEHSEVFKRIANEINKIGETEFSEDFKKIMSEINKIGENK